MSSLAAQLKQLAQQNPFASNIKAIKHRATFLYADQPKSVQDRDVEDVYAIGLNGLLELTRLDSRFRDFEPLLFSAQSKSMDRTLQTAEENAKLNETLNAFLRLLSPHFLLKPAGKALEWLVWRFFVHEYNVDALVGCVLPYHETSHFIRVCKLLQSGNCGSWEFLVKIGKSSLPLDRLSLIHQCRKQPGLLDFIMRLIKEALENNVVSTTLIAFYSLTFISYLRSLDRINENVVLKMLPFLLHLVQEKKDKSMQLSAYMVISALSQKAALSAESCNELLKKVAQYANDVPSALLCVLHVVQSQDAIAALPDAVVKAVLHLSNYEAVLGAMRMKYDTKRFELLFLLGCVQMNKFTAISNVVASSELVLSDDVVRALAEAIWQRMKVTDNQDPWSVVFQCMNTRYAMAMDGFLNSISDSQSMQLLEKVFSGTRNTWISDAQTTLALGISHPSNAVRLASVNKLLKESKNFVELDRSFFSSAIVQALGDEDEVIIRMILEHRDCWVAYVNISEAVDALKLIAKNVKSKEMKTLVLQALLAQPIYESEWKTADAIVLSLFWSNESITKCLIDVVGNMSNSYEVTCGLLRTWNGIKWDSDSLYLSLFIQNLARLVLKEPNLLDELRALTESEDVGSRALSICVCAKVAYDSEDKLKVEATKKLLEIIERDLKANEVLELVDLKSVNGLPSVETLQCSSQSSTTASQTISTVLCVALGILVESFPVLPEQGSVWLSHNSQSSQNDRDIANLLVQAFEVLSLQLSGVFFQEQLKLLLERSFGKSEKGNNRYLLSFLLHVALLPSVALPAKLVALHLLAKMVENATVGKWTTDFQVLLPSTFILITDKDRQVRQLALHLFDAIRKAYQIEVDSESKKKKKKTSAKIAGSSIFYGPITSRGVLFLPTQDASSFMSIISKTMESSATDPAFLPTFLRSFFSKKTNEKEEIAQRQKYLDSFMSHFEVCTMLTFRCRLLKCFDLVDNKCKAKSCLTVLDQLAASLNELLSEPNTEPFELLIFAVRAYGPSVASSLSEGKKLEAVFYGFLDRLIGAEVYKESHLAKQRFRLLSQETCHIISGLFSRLKVDAQAKMLENIIGHLLLNAQNMDLLAFARNCLMELAIPCSLITQLLSKCVSNITSSTNDERASKKAMVVAAEHTDNSKELAALMLTRYVEIVHANKLLQTRHELIPTLFELLGSMVGFPSTGLGHVSFEYSIQLVLTALASLLNSWNTDLHSKYEAHLRADLISQLIRSTTNPQTQNLALQVMASIGTINPERVLQSMMPVFAFMGANALRQDDDFSFHVIEKALKAIVPTLIQSGQSDQLTQDLLNVFVHALFHIPRHRRLKLFVLFVRQLGVEAFLPRLLCMALSKHDKSGKDRVDPVDESVQQFSSAFLSQFDVIVQIKTLTNMLIAVQPLLCEPQNVDGMRSLKVDSIVPFVAQQLKDVAFLAQLDRYEPVPGEDFTTQQCFTLLIESALKLLGLIQTMIRGEKTKYVPVYKATMNVLEYANGLLGLNEFAAITVQLLANEYEDIRGKAVLLLNERMNLTRTSELKANANALLNIIPAALTILQTPSEKVATKQNMLIALGILCREFGSEHGKNMLTVVDPLLSGYALQSKDSDVQMSALACLSAFVDILGPQMLPKLSIFMPQVVSLFEQACMSPDDDLLAFGSVTAVKNIVQRLPQFLGPYLDKLLSCLLHPAFAVDEIDEEVEDLVQETIDEMAKSIASRILLPHIFSFMANAENYGPISLCRYFELLAKAISAMKKDDIGGHYKQLFKFFLTAFDLRSTTKNQEVQADVGEVERQALLAFVKLILKLNETLFKPLFLKFVDWATTEAATDDRLKENRSIFLFRSLDVLLDHLKSIFAPYCNYTIDTAIEWLKQYANGIAHDQRWDVLISSLTKMMLYDNDGFLNENLLSGLITPLVDQLQLNTMNKTVYSDCMEKTMVPCLGQLAIAIHRTEPSLLKQLNHQVLMKTRDEQPSVRLAALRATKEFYERMGDEFLVHLPETVPFLAELLEDDDESVEALCRDVIKVVEEHLGESLQEHLK